MWLVGKLSNTLPVNITDKVSKHSEQIEIDLCWAYGMVGVCPVFASEDAAKRHAGNAPIYFLQDYESKTLTGGEGNE